MAELQTSVRVRAEGVGITSKAVVTFLILFYDSQRGDGKMAGELALLAFAWGQVAYGLSLLVVYLSNYGSRFLWFKKDRDSRYGAYIILAVDWAEGQVRRVTVLFDPEILRLSFTMTLQSVVKHVLTEGDKFVLSWFSPLQDQGGYAIAVNYGTFR